MERARATRGGRWGLTPKNARPATTRVRAGNPSRGRHRRCVRGLHTVRRRHYLASLSGLTLHAPELAPCDDRDMRRRYFWLTAGSLPLLGLLACGASPRAHAPVIGDDM